MALVVGFECLELCLYGIRELISTNQSSVFGRIWTNERSTLPSSVLDRMTV